jgi:protein-disulfide isomerase
MVSDKSIPIRKIRHGKSREPEHKATHEQAHDNIKTSENNSPKEEIVQEHKTEHKQIHKTEHRSAAGYDASKGSDLWKYAAAVLAVLFIASVFTRGFSFDPVASAKADLTKLMQKSTDQTVKNSIQDALTSIDKAKELMSTKPAKASNYAGTKPKLDFYVMSQCPYGTQVEDAVKPALDKLKGSVDFSVNFIASDLGDGTFRSLHGDNEVQGDIVQLCAMKYNPDNYMDLIVCMNQNAASIPGNWQKCVQDNNLDVQKIKTCYEGAEGKQLLAESIKKSEAVNAQGSPTMFLNGQPYESNRDTLSFLRALCSNLDNHPECANMPACGSDADCTAQSDKVGKCTNPGTDSAKCEYSEPSSVNLIVINDKLCKDCQQFSVLTDQLKTIFKGLKVTEYDFSDAKGEQLYIQLGLTALPAFLFDSTVQKGEGYANVRNYLEPVGDYTLLRVGASYDPMSEICDNGVDDRDQDGLIDCADDECKSQWQCMEKKDKPVVELFVMSHCPYGTQMEKGILPVVDLLGNKIDFSVKFVYYAMHGEQEVQEELRQYCIETEQDSKYLDYLKCFLKAGDSQTCLTEAGVDKTKLDTCTAATDTKFSVTKNFNDQSGWLSGQFPKVDLFKDLNEKYGVQGSPTLVINGVVASAGRDPQSLLDAVCTGFKVKPAECSQSLSTSAYTAGFGFTQSAAAADTASANCGG